jgi:putative protease
MIFHNEDLNDLDDYLIELDNIGIDAYIVSDFAVIEAIKRLKLKTKFFISTQKSITNLEAIKFYKSLGAYRVVLARECSREDIKYIKENIDTEVEVFIHGAMCTSYSGRCVMSNYVTLRDSNRGGCSQICRFNFKNKDNPDYLMSSKDLNMSSYIEDMINIGIESFKIEGRMKSLYYIATVTNAYRNIIDKAYNKTLTKDVLDYYERVLNRCSNRENAPQFYNKYPKVNEQYFSGREEVSNQDFLAIVKDYDEEGNLAIIEQRNFFKIGSEVEIFGPNMEPIAYKINTILNDKNELVDAARHPQESLKINVPCKVCKGDIIRVKIS